MDIEAIVKKYYEEWQTVPEASIQDQMRAALTEQAAEYDRKQALLLDAHCERVSSLQERIRQLEARLGGYLTVGGGNIVHGTAEALARVQAYILLDSKHPVEARDTNRYFAKQLQAAEQRIRQLEAERVPDDEKAKSYHDVAQRLYALLDDIDTAGDIAKDDDALYRGIVERTQAKKGVFVISCDGYTVRLVDDSMLAAAPQPKKEGE